MQVAERRPLEELCDSALASAVSVLGTSEIIAVGNYAYGRAIRALAARPWVKVNCWTIGMH